MEETKENKKAQNEQENKHISGRAIMLSGLAGWFIAFTHLFIVGLVVNGISDEEIIHCLLIAAIPGIVTGVVTAYALHSIIKK